MSSPLTGKSRACKFGHWKLNFLSIWWLPCQSLKAYIFKIAISWIGNVYSMLTIIIYFKLYFFKSFHSGSVYALKGRLIPHKLFCPNLLLGLFIDHLLTLTYLYTMPIFLIQESSGCWSLGEITSHRRTHNKMNHLLAVKELPQTWASQCVKKNPI